MTELIKPIDRVIQGFHFTVSNIVVKQAINGFFLSYYRNCTKLGLKSSKCNFSIQGQFLNTGLIDLEKLKEHFVEIFSDTGDELKRKSFIWSTFPALCQYNICNEPSAKSLKFLEMNLNHPNLPDLIASMWMNNSSFIYSVFQSICSFTSVADENFKQVKISKSLIESFSYLTDYNIKAYKLLETDENKKKFFVNNFLPNLIEEFAHSQYNDVDNFADVNFGEIFDAVKDEIGKAYTELPSFRNIFPAEYCINLISQTDYSILFDQQIKKPDHKNLYIVKYPVEVIGTNFEEIKKSSKEDKRILDQLEESIYNLQMDMDQYQASLLRNFIHKVIPSEKNKLKTDYNLIRKNILDLFKTGINASIGKIMNTLRSKLITKDDLNSDSWIADFLEFHNDVVASEIPVYYPLLVAIIELKFMKSRENVLNNFKFNAENDPPTTFQPDCPFKNGETKECLENAFTVLSTCLINLNTNADPNKGIKYNDAVFYFDTMYDFIIYKPNPVSHENLKEKKYISTVFQRLFNCRLSFANYLKSFSNLAKDPVEFLRIPKEIEENNRKLADSLSNEF